MPKSNPSKTHQVNPPYKPNPHVKIPPFPSALITHHSPLPLIYDLLNESEREREREGEKQGQEFLFFSIINASQRESKGVISLQFSH